MLDPVLEILKTLSWPHTIPLAIVIAVIVLRKPLSRLVDRLQSIRAEGNKYDFLFDKANPESVPQAGEKVIEPDDVIKAFKEIPDFTYEETKAEIQPVLANLLMNGIVSKKALNGLVKSQQTLDALRSLYVELLGRPKDKPLDPVAVATWGAGLFRYGVRPEVVTAVRNGIMNSPEFKRRLARLREGQQWHPTERRSRAAR